MSPEAKELPFMIHSGVSLSHEKEQINEAHTFKRERRALRGFSGKRREAFWAVSGAGRWRGTKKMIAKVKTGVDRGIAQHP